MLGLESFSSLEWIFVGCDPEPSFKNVGANVGFTAVVWESWLFRFRALAFCEMRGYTCSQPGCILRGVRLMRTAAREYGNGVG